MLTKEQVLNRDSENLTIKESREINDSIFQRCIDIWSFIANQLEPGFNKDHFKYVVEEHASVFNIDEKSNLVTVPYELPLNDDINNKFIPYHKQEFCSKFPLNYLWEDYETEVIATLQEAKEKTIQYNVEKAQKKLKQKQNQTSRHNERLAAFKQIIAKLSPEDIKLIKEVGPNKLYSFLLQGQ